MFLKIILFIIILISALVGLRLLFKYVILYMIIEAHEVKSLIGQNPINKKNDILIKYEVEELLKEGKQIAAISYLKYNTDLTIKECNDYINDLFASDLELKIKFDNSEIQQNIINLKGERYV